MDNKLLNVKSFKTLYSALLIKFKSMIKKSDWNQNDKNADDYIKNRTHYSEMIDDVEVVHKLDKKYLPEHIHDWNDLDNKPFYEEDNRTAIILDHQTLNEFNQWDDQYVCFDINLNLNFQLEVGKNYTVNWDSVEYITELKSEDGGWYLGFNPYYPEYDYPFGIWFNYAGGISTINSIHSTSSDSSHTISIYEGTLEIKKLDEKFLPDLVNIGGGESSFITVDELIDYGAVVEYTESTNYNSYKIKVTKDFISPKQIIVVDTKDAKDTMVRFYYINPDASEKMIGMTTVYANNYRYFTIENDYFVTSVSQTKFQIEVTDILATNRYYANIDKSTGVFESKNSYVLTGSDLALYYANTNSASESYEPTSDYNLTTKKYVDTSLSDKKNKDLIVTITSATAENGIQTYSADKTFEEIIEAYNNGASVYAVLSGMKLECTKVSTTNAWFGYFNAFNMIDHTITIKSDNTISYSYTYRTAKANVYGGVKADTKSDTDTVPAKIGEDGKLYVPSYPALDGLASEDYVSDQIDLVEQEINTLSTEIKNIDIPTNVSDLNNDSGFITRTVQNLANYYLKSETYSQEEINAKLSAIPKFAIQPVDILPTSDISVTTVYLLKSGEESQNLYTEYIYVNNTWEYLGTQTVDLSGYALKLDIPTKLSDLTNDSGFITKNVSDLVNYYKKTEVYSKNEIDAKKYLTEHQDLSAYAKTSQIPTKVSQLTNDSKFLTAIPNEYVTESELEAKGYLTQHQDLSSYAKKATTLAGYGITDGATKTELNKLNSEKIGQTELASEVAAALQDAKDSGVFDGQDGDDGVSCTHSWNGATLTITSASGSSSANLKGEKGVSGVYVGSGDMPDGYNIQIDPEGDADLNNYNWFTEGISIPSNSDLNNYTTAGAYYVGSTSIAGTIKNAPVTNSNYKLYVIVRTNSKSISQIIFALNNKIYMRSATASGSLSGWKTFATLDDLDDFVTKTELSQLEETVADYPVTVKSYGAKGDGTTNDTTAIQNALAENRKVYIPAGTYKISGELVVRDNCELMLAQDAVLNFTQTSGNCITLNRSSSLRGNHATIIVPYAFAGIVVNADTSVHTDTKDVPPWKHWDPQWKTARYMTDINICKFDKYGVHRSTSGDSNGTAIYISANGSSTSTFMWGVNYSGIRISGAFEYGIRAQNFNKGWNHEMHIEAVIESCKIGIELDSCNKAYIVATIQPKSAENGAVYAEHGVVLRNTIDTDLIGCRVWDWNDNHSKWTYEKSCVYQHIAMYGDCKGTILNDYMYHNLPSGFNDIRELIYTDRTANFDSLIILQEPFDRWFKNVDDAPYFNGTDGNQKRLVLKEEQDALFETSYIPAFDDKLAKATDGAGAIFNEIGYIQGYYWNINGTGLVSSNWHVSTGLIYCGKGAKLYLEGMSYDSGDADARIILFDSSGNRILHINRDNILATGYHITEYESTDNGCIITFNPALDIAYVRISVHTSAFGSNPVITVNEEIAYTQVGTLTSGVKVHESNLIGMDNYEKKGRMTTQISSTSTDAQYPTAKAVYDAIQSSISGINSAVNEVAALIGGDA